MSSRRRPSTSRRRLRSPSPEPTPSLPSPQQSPPPELLDIHFPNSEMRVKWKNQFSTMNVDVEKDYDFDSLDGVFNGFNFTNALTATGLIKLFQLPTEAYTELVQIFYSNATLNEVVDVGTSHLYPWRDTGRTQSDTFTTYVFGQAIEVTPAYVNDILGLEQGGIRMSRNWDMAEAFQRVFGAPICPGETQAEHMRHVKQANFPLISRILHHMITWTISPRSNLNYVSHEDVFLIDAILQHQRVDVGYLVFRNLRRSIFRKDSHLYSGRLITRILKFNDFDLTEHRCVKARKPFTSVDIQKKLPFRLDPNTQQYCRNQSQQQQQQGAATAPNIGDPSPDMQWAIEEWHQVMEGRGTFPQQEYCQQQMPTSHQAGGESSSSSNPMDNLLYELRELRMQQNYRFGRIETQFNDFQSNVNARFNTLQSSFDASQRTNNERWNILCSQANRFEDYFNWCGFPDNPPPWQQPHDPPTGGGGQSGGRQDSGSSSSFSQDL